MTANTGLNQTGKPCRICKAVKPLDAYYAHPTTRDFKFTACIECVRANTRARDKAQRGRPRGDKTVKAQLTEARAERKREREAAARLAHATRWGTE